jgi:hypothetical protein
MEAKVGTRCCLEQFIGGIVQVSPLGNSVWAVRVVSGFATTINRPRRRAFVDVYVDGNIKRRRYSPVGHVRKATTTWSS